MDLPIRASTSAKRSADEFSSVEHAWTLHAANYVWNSAAQLCARLVINWLSRERQVWTRIRKEIGIIIGVMLYTSNEQNEE